MSSDAFLQALANTSEIDLTVTGRKSGAAITFPVWFALEGRKLYLLPIYGSKSNWYKNAAAHPSIRISAGGRQAQVNVQTVTGPEEVARITSLFRERYGAADVARYYSNFDAALEADL